MALMNPYLNFAGTAREAMEHYRSVFGGRLEVSTFGEYGAGPDGPPADGVMHAQLRTDDDFVLMASDLPPGEEHARNGWISISGDEGDTIRGWFARLSDGGEVHMALERQMWGDEFGSCTDRFGIGWMVNISAPGQGQDQA